MDKETKNIEYIYVKVPRLDVILRYRTPAKTRKVKAYKEPTCFICGKDITVGHDYYEKHGKEIHKECGDSNTVKHEEDTQN